MTFSVVARSADGSSWGVAVASKFLAVGSVVPAAVAGIGALATQADAHVGWKGLALSLLDEGATASVAVDRLVADDASASHRQLGVVDMDGGAAAHTGADCLPWAGDVVVAGATFQGNVLVGPEVLAAMREAWEGNADEPVLARRLLAVLQAGDRAGGDRRGRQSAALLVVSEGAGYGGLDDDLRSELEALARATGQPDLAAWVGCENYEMRVDLDGQPGWVDAVVLQALRADQAR